MKAKQRGATLLEAILAVAVIGWVLAYSGAQLIRTAKEKELEKAAGKVVELQYVIKQYMTDIYLLTDKDAPLDKVVNPILEIDELGPDIQLSNKLEWLKNASCKFTDGSSGDIPSDVLRRYLNCNYSADVFSLNYLGSSFDFKRYDNITYPKAKRIAIDGSSVYVANSANFQDFYSVVGKLTNIEEDDGYKITEDNIEIGEISVSGEKYRWVGERKTLSEFLSNDIEEIDAFIKKIETSANKVGLKIRIYYENDISLKRDGSIPIAIGASLCWDSASSSSRPCISLNSSKDEPNKDHIVIDSGLVFGKDKKRTPVIIDYHSFGSSGSPVEVNFLSCPIGDRWSNKIVAINSSFSSGSEAGTNFSNPEEIISKGTKGADGKHAFISGLSLEWKAIDEKWEIKGAVAIDAAFEKDNGNSSLLKNPKSMSFITMQWCEEE
ncbi:toxin co-regulated pilus biosynthesis protein B [Vibrio sp. N418]|uniref:type II secretion system protein n=1 Tax=Vibrio sp. (strain N418) TaxID=701176 RepID=UPI00021BDF21|nr:type II secretion system protein [Vibrio sp. N418]EGU34485.1 toxin co-regulated pilus biosynthesis protein B [Vibrio sp. N418]